jgi:two-component system, OmpR family, sensor kinase
VRRLFRSLSLQEHITGLVLTVMFLSMAALILGVHEFIRTALLARVSPTFTEESALSVLSQYDFILTSIALLVWIASGLLIWFVARLALRPLARAERAAAQIAAGNYRVRLPVGHRSTEINRLYSTINLMAAGIDQAVSAQAETTARMREFVSDASHEMRTPLVTVRGYAELYRIGALTDEEAVRTAFHRIEHEATRLSSLVEDLLTLVRVGTVSHGAAETFDLCAIAAECAHDARARSPERTVTVDAPEPIMVHGHRDQLRQVIVNLLANALRFSGGPVELRVRRHARAITLQCIDHGEGIPPEARERVFERFWRGESSRARSTGGTGLGLAIVRAIVEEHHGEIHIGDTYGGGATFTVVLPTPESASAAAH